MSACLATPAARPLSIPWTNLGDAFGGWDNDPALIDLHGNQTRTFTHAEIRAAAAAYARLLLTHGLTRGDRVAILSANRAEALFAIYGVMRAGLVAVPINWKLPAAAVGWIIQDCGAKTVLHDASRRALCPPGPALIDLDQRLIDNWAEAAVPDPHDPALILYTSGSTGRPKGVVLSHHSHLWVLDVRVRQTKAPARTLVAAPLFHMNALSTVQACWATGGTVILLPGFEPASYIAAAAAHRASLITAVPSMIAAMLLHPTLRHADLSSVTTIRVGSAPLGPALAASIGARFPAATLLNGYGTTEAGPIVFTPQPGQPRASVGAAHTEAELRLVAAGAILDGPGDGTLEVRCPALMTGYHGLPGETAAALTTDGFYRTGDVFHRDAQGCFTFVGRTDDMFVSAGENIWPGEIEAVLASHPDVHQVAVVAAPDPLRGAKPVAFVVLRPGAACTEAELQGYVAGRAPAYHRPRRVWFLAGLPLAGTDKIDRLALERAARQEGG